MSEPVREIAIAIRGVSAMGRIVLPCTLPLSREPRRVIGRTLFPVVKVIARVVDLIVPVSAVIFVVVVVVVDGGGTVAPIVISPYVITGRSKSIADVRVTSIRIA